MAVSECHPLDTRFPHQTGPALALPAGVAAFSGGCHRCRVSAAGMAAPSSMQPTLPTLGCRRRCLPAAAATNAAPHLCMVCGRLPWLLLSHMMSCSGLLQAVAAVANAHHAAAGAGCPAGEHFGGALAGPTAAGRVPAVLASGPCSGSCSSRLRQPDELATHATQLRRGLPLHCQHCQQRPCRHRQPRSAPAPIPAAAAAAAATATAGPPGAAQRTRAHRMLRPGLRRLRVDGLLREPN